MTVVYQISFYLGPQTYQSPIMYYVNCCVCSLFSFLALHGLCMALTPVFFCMAIDLWLAPTRVYPHSFRLFFSQHFTVTFFPLHFSSSVLVTIIICWKTFWSEVSVTRWSTVPCVFFLGVPVPTGTPIRRENKSSSRFEHYIRAFGGKGGLKGVFFVDFGAHREYSGFFYFSHILG